MTLQIIGALLIVLGSSLEGFRRSHLLQRRQHVLIEFAQGFTWMQNEIVKRQTPILDIIQTQMKRNDDLGRLNRYFFDQLTEKQLLLGEAWREAVRLYQQTSILQKEDIEWINRVGEAIQPFDRQSIERELSFIIEMLRNRHQEARNKSIQFGKLYKTLGVMGGILIVLLLS